MTNLYSEKQYKEYSALMNEIISDTGGLHVHLKLENWIHENKLSDEIVDQMDERFENELLSNSK